MHKVTPRFTIKRRLFCDDMFVCFYKSFYYPCSASFELLVQPQGFFAAGDGTHTRVYCPVLAN